MLVASVAIYETRATGALQSVQFFRENSSSWDIVWEGCPGQLNETGGRVFVPPLLARAYKTHRIRLEFDTSGFSSCYAIDGVEVIVGVQPELPVFVCAACPSAYYKNLTGESQCQELGRLGTGECIEQLVSNVSSRFKCPDLPPTPTPKEDTTNKTTVTCPAGSFPSDQTCKAKVTCRGPCCGGGDLEPPLAALNPRISLYPNQIVGIRPGNKIPRWGRFSEDDPARQPTLAVQNGSQYVKFEKSTEARLNGGPLALNFQSAGER